MARWLIGSPYRAVPALKPASIARGKNPCSATVWDVRLWPRSHLLKRTSQTVALQGFFPRAMEAGFRAGTARYGLPISHLAIRYVNGYAYAQMQMAGVPAKAAGSGPPPRPILFALVRLLPE